MLCELSNKMPGSIQIVSSLTF